MVRLISDAKRFKLYHGRYASPKCRVGDWLPDEYASVRGSAYGRRTENRRSFPRCGPRPVRECMRCLAGTSSTSAGTPSSASSAATA